MVNRRVVRTPMSVGEWESLVESTKRWAYDVCRSDVDTDHPEGVWVLDKPFNELCAHVATSDAKLGAWVVDTLDEVEWRIYGPGDRDTRRLIAKLDSRSAACAIVDAHNRGVDDAEKAIRESSADLLERSGREREELEERVEQLKDALKIYADAENWHDDYEDGCFVEQVVWRGMKDTDAFPAGPDLAIVALSDLKKEEEDGHAIPSA